MTFLPFSFCKPSFSVNETNFLPSSSRSLSLSLSLSISISFAYLFNLLKLWTAVTAKCASNCSLLSLFLSVCLFPSTLCFILSLCLPISMSFVLFLTYCFYNSFSSLSVSFNFFLLCFCISFYRISCPFCLSLSLYLLIFPCFISLSHYFSLSLNIFLPVCYHFFCLFRPSVSSCLSEFLCLPICLPTETLSLPVLFYLPVSVSFPVSSCLSISSCLSVSV